jgi:hypothetical protein
MSNVIGKMEITKIIDNEDGSATVMFDMDWEAIRAFAKIGLLQVLTEAAQGMLDCDEVLVDEESTSEA